MDFHPKLIVFLNFIFILLLFKVNSVQTFLFKNEFHVQKLDTPEAKIKITKDDALCAKQVMLLVGSYQRKDLWALKVFDAWGKSQSGLFSGNLINFGHYEQCLEMKHKFNDTSVGTFNGQHCMVFFKDSPQASSDSFDATDIQDLILPQVMHIELMRQYMNVLDVRMGTALCIPSLCTAAIVRRIADRMLSKNRLKTTTDYDQEIFCNTNNIMEFRSIDMLAA
jgi:Nose resistant-to-fluoxetine protein, N-terminal domain